MNLLFKNPGLTYSIDSIMMFQTEEQSEWWRDTLFAYYPQINRKHFESLQPDEQTVYLTDVLSALYEHEESSITAKIKMYNNHWQLHKTQIEEAFSAAFQIDCHNILNNMTGNITLNPICPRFLDTCSFDVFYMNSERGALGMALHEIVHFVWFYVWHQHFHDDVNEYETPHLKWVFSEMAVDPIMRKDSRLIAVNPYFNDGCAYDYFYKMMIDGKPILESLYAIYESANMLTFMEQGYAYCVKHEAEIRAQMK